MSDLAAGPGGRDVSGGGIGMRQAPRARFQYPEYWEPQYVTGAEAVAAPSLLRRGAVWTPVRDNVFTTKKGRYD